MPRLFGTDGIRGVANVDLKPTIAFALGRATAFRLVGPGGSIVVGQDTRRSGDMFVAAIAAGATSLGVSVHVVGVVPTPALAFLAGDGEDAAGIMVSASHNPADDNGLKVLDADGLKLDDTVEDELEQLIWRSDELAGSAPATLGTIIDARDRLGRYVAHREGLAASIHGRGLRIIVDAANGSASAVAGRIIGATGASVEVMNDRPDGLNINLRCGATDPAALAARVAATGADLGFALDGDADRCVAVDGSGQVVDGDRLIGLLALNRLARSGADAADPAIGTVVVSVLSNGGLQQAVEGAGGTVVRTPVGDKYILEGMQVSGAGLGGEKSGHVIVREHTTSGDGLVTALEVLRVVTTTDVSLAELAAQIPLLPQEQRAVRVRHKEQWEGDPVLRRAIADAERRLGDGGGRVLVRPSGTEPSLRVMIEGSDMALVRELADGLSALAEQRLN
ncbi:MAG TPA: phosphoglucosamine mutase [Candidatus Limnocylindrales bacterium]|nr:phosphoglucosamine mutase [Candidatus Limnocylindrales bacterium]